jgi:muramoyltetrapeptide carboxypeptidase
MITIPPYLKKGQTIGITCPAGYMDKERANACITTLQSWGFDVMVGKTVGSKSKNYFSGTDEERADELQAMLDDDQIHAIIFGRGGYGVTRIIDQLNFKKFYQHPKWLIGFSDITALHCHVLKNHKIATLHAPMAGAFNDNNFFINQLHQTIIGKKLNYKIDSHPFNQIGETTGKLVGGNLALLCNIIGTKSDFDTKNKILFIEDVGEYLYTIDRMLRQLKRAGKFEKVSGLIFGGFTDLKDTERKFGKTIEEIIKEVIQDYAVPVAFQFPISHNKENLAVKIGVTYQLKITKSTTYLKEI